MTELPQSPRLSPGHLEDLLTDAHGRHRDMSDQARMRSLLQAVLTIGGDLDLATVLRRLTEMAAQLVGARYAGLGVIDGDGGFSEFIPVGIGREQAERISRFPHGKGVLGAPLHDRSPLRLADLRDHPDFGGFPDGHPPMSSFLGVPIQVRDEIFGNLYLTEKADGGEFDEDDESVVLALATAAGVAIENARLYEEARLRERWLAASTEITTRLLSGAATGEVLTYMAAQAREIGGADTAVILLPDPRARDHLFAEIADGPIAQEILGTPVEIHGTGCGRVYESGEPMSIPDLRLVDCPMLTQRGYGPGLLVPLGTPGNTRGVLLLGKLSERAPFPSTVRRMLHSFSVQAGIALELAEARQDTERLVVLEERDRIAKDLHDVVIQRLFASAMTLMSTMRLISSQEAGERVQRTIDELDATIREIRSTIFALQNPPSRQDTSLRGRILKLAENTAYSLGCHPGVSLDGPIDASVPDEVGEQLLAVLGESLSNVARHARATEVHVSVTVEETATTGRPTTLTLTVTDNGVGLPEEGRRSGLRNMDERARALGGGFSARRGETGGTVLTWKVPVPDDGTPPFDTFH
ncbi:MULTISPECIES: sensor histidine kinase [Nocardiopsis]|uniref:GAF domain-containing sensor histidine kinase n=1 Tax=Nocardiopsis lambiniae TaxID=3075539 RepID=A0ABU2MB01_9ACTN|nr:MULTISPECIES: GAF domain-containing sensor histidine kinase [unclassified Nocardiopsis]MDE3723995.1 GAF domain-containing sensor histidine kinase [Nocardiopsis sp. N85]MDT0329851.1 GAF domain-containing sensor histidine kinase [Nocardiopsis sp. DSM 44743]